jgi:cytochrome c oxidase subunit II
MKAIDRTITRAVAAAALALTACAGPQSTLAPAGYAAQRIADLFWAMTIGSVLIWLAVVGLAAHAIYRRRAVQDARSGRRLIVGGGVIFPTIVLALLLGYGLSMLPPLLAAAPAGSLRVSVSGEQFWWRVRYPEHEGGSAFELANELRVPVGAHVELELASTDVIHSFWIPALGGKVDMIPGRTTQLTLLPTRTGVFNGVCAEYCGTSHAFMAFRVVVLERAAFADWRKQQRGPARAPADALAAQGGELFAESGCGACHTVRGTGARGVVGPDLTHFGSRLSLGAGMLPNEPEQLVRWLGRTDRVKPGVLMPHFGMLPEPHLRALAAYLKGLQ